MHSVDRLVGVLLAVACWACVSTPARAEEERKFEFTYSCKINDVPTGAKHVDLWMPVPSDCQGQTVANVNIARPVGGKISVDPAYGNRIFHKRFSGSEEPDLPMGAELVFRVHRREVIIDAAKSSTPGRYTAPSADLAVYLAPNALIPLDGRVADIARELELQQNKPIETAQKIYDHLIETMTRSRRCAVGV